MVPSIEYLFDNLTKSAWPVNSVEATNLLTEEYSCRIAKLLNSEAPEYHDDIINMVSVSQSHPQFMIQIGNSFDVISLLNCHGFGIADKSGYLVRNNGEKVEVDEETYRGKYVLVCCFYVPVLREDTYSDCVQGLVTTCSELYSMRGDFEMVMVAKMNKLANYKVVFDHFFAGFPTQCLAVPWEDSRRSDYICKYLDLGHGCFKCLLLDKKGLVLPFDPSSLKLYGIEAFPFTVGEELPSLEEYFFNCYPPRSRCSTASFKLEDLLNCSPDDVLYKIYRGSGSRKKVSISKLNKRVVGLYLCVEGNLIPTLHKVHKQCKSRRLEFEIVVVYLPFVDCVDPQVYQENIDRRLRRRKVSWLRFPFNNSVSRRFWRLTCCYPDDRLMIVGPNAEFVDLYGGDVMMSYGIDAYPFTREGLIQRKINKVRALTLDHLVYRSRDYVLRCDDRTAVPVRVEELKGRNVFLYFDSLDNIDINDVDHGELVSWYYAIKAKVPDFEVVFVCFNDEENDLLSIEEIEEKLCAMPWLICPYDPDHSAFLKNLIGGGALESLIGFGKDGRVCAFQLLTLVTTIGPHAFPLDDHLRKDIIQKFCDSHEFMYDMMYSNIDSHSSNMYY